MTKCAKCGKPVKLVVTLTSGGRTTPPLCSTCFRGTCREAPKQVKRRRAMKQEQEAPVATPNARLDDIKKIANEVLRKRVVWEAKKADAAEAKKDFDLESAKLLDFIVDENETPLFDGVEDDPEPEPEDDSEPDTSPEHVEGADEPIGDEGKTEVF